MPKLTKRTVEAAIPRDRQFTIWCSDLAGFGVFINPTGKRSYFVDYRNDAGLRRRMTIGQHGKITTEEARKLAIATLGSAVRGNDPGGERAERRKAITVSELCTRYLEGSYSGLVTGRRGTRKKPSSLLIEAGRIDRHIVPLLGRRLVNELVPADVYRFMRDVTSGKTAVVAVSDKKRGKVVVTGGAGTAARTVGLLGGILSYAVSEGIIETNPTRGVKKPAGQRRERRLSPDDYRALGQALQRADGEAETPQVIQAIWLLALTGCRRGEIVSLRWSEVDSDGMSLRLQDSKTGASVRPIGSPVINLLSTIKRDPQLLFVLPAVRGDGPFGGFPRGWARIMERAGLEDVTPHTLRHSFASVAGDLGFAESTIAALIGHAAGSVTSRYIHRLDSVMVASADKVAKAVLDQMSDSSSGFPPKL
ncbi:tyrosine-type recombinase/integrase [Kaistia terrae]|uniref:Tyrosine-type recombinase/integrase n=1 Tax=Kaistia terrae TaxID=537017 RepID=A0ABW0Q511_9HYPH|nr:site-specific integrase [Kaistia terrae]MCX5581222.1 site-specific integrase [Kaistia terrae]